MLKKYSLLPIFFVVISTLLYAYFAYFLDRSEFELLMGFYLILFLIFIYFMKNNQLSFWQLSWLSIGFRLIFLFSLPALSQDFYRFIWDGRIWAAGVSPYLFTPDEVMLQFPELIPQGEALVKGMQSLSASHYSNYPPVSQWIYGLAASLSPNSILGGVVVLRIMIIVADIGILYFGKKTLEHLHLPIKSIYWFVLNPFVILEFTGNLHLEGVMLCLLLMGLYLLFLHQSIASAVFVGLSIATKLLPLLLLPVLFHFFKPKNQTNYFSIPHFASFTAYVFFVFGVFATSFWGLVNGEFIQNFGSSVGLWFGTFEFNASVYYVLRWIGYQFVGWNTIATLSKILPLLVLFFVLYLSFIQRFQTKQIFVALLFAVTVYLLLATTVHPWYLATPLLLSVFTKYRFIVVWSFVVMLSYAAYQNETYQENLWLVAVEYAVVLLVLIYELFFLKPKNEVRLK